MRKIVAVARKEIRQISRDPLTLFLLLGLPSFMLVLFGYAISFDVENLPMALQDRDKSRASRELIASFVNSRRFRLVSELPAGADPGALFTTRRARMVLVIPEDFSRQLAAGRSAQIQLLLDGTDSNTAATALGYANGLVAAANAEILLRFVRSRGIETSIHSQINFQPRVWFNQELISSHFLVPGLIGFILMVIAVLSTALSLVREKEHGTIEQLRVAPLSSFQVLIGKIIPYMMIAFVALILILVAARELFGVHVTGSYAALFAATLVYLLGAFSFGLLISTIADSQAVAFQIGVFASVMPTLLLSGFIFPIRNMPDFLQILTHIIPARYYLVILRGIILKGTDLTPYLDQLGYLSLYTAAVLILASARFARQGG